MSCINGVIKSLISRRSLGTNLKQPLPILTSQRCCNTKTTPQKVSENENRSSASVATGKKTQNFPFAKSLFLGRFDQDILTYPEVLDKEKLQNLEERIRPIDNFFSTIDSKKIDESGHIPQEVLDGLASLGLFGQQVPEEYGGLGLNATEYTRLSEATGVNPSIAMSLAAHQTAGFKALLLAGTEEQKRRYLPYLASGEWTGAFCLTEAESGSDIAGIQTTAELSEDKTKWILNGKKIWISNGSTANFFTVFAKTKMKDIKGELQDTITAFVVERNFGRITTGKPQDKLGVRGLDTCDVTFENTSVPVENILGEVGEGFKIAMNVMNSGRFDTGSSSAGFLKSLIKFTTEHAINRRIFGKSLSDFELIREKLAKVVCLTYTMESMSYLIAGMLDTYQNPDCAVESSIVKVFSSEATWTVVSECLRILGGMGYMRDYPYEQYLRDSRCSLIFEGTNEVQKMFIALVGVHHAGTELQETVMKMRNPLMNPNYIFSKMYRNRGQANDKPKLNLGLEGYLHPSLQHAAKLLEYCVLRLQYGVEVALSRHGQEIVDKQLLLQRLCDVAVDILAMTAVLGRSSRSYCIGLQNAQDEIIMATTICHDAQNRVKRNILEVEQMSVLNADDYYLKVAKQVIKSRGYFPEHPLARNY